MLRVLPGESPAQTVFHFPYLFIIGELQTEPQSMQHAINMRNLHVVWTRYIYCFRHVATVGGMSCRVSGGTSTAT